MALNSSDLALSFSKQWEIFGNSSSPELIKLWTIIFQTFNDSIERNVSGAELEYSVIPAVTGSGKTLCYQWYAAELAKKAARSDKPQPGMLIVTTLTREADEAVKNINSWAGGQVAVAYHSGSFIKQMHDEDCLKGFQIVVITHEYFKRHHHLKSLRNNTYQKVISFGDLERSLIVIDESIEMVNNICIAQKDINRVEVNLGTLLSKGHDQLYDEHRLLQYLDQHYKTLFIDTSQLAKPPAFIHLSNKDNLVASISRDLDLTQKKVVDLFSLRHSIKVLETDELLKINPALRIDGKDDIVTAANDLQYLLDDNLYLYQNKEYRTSTMELPLRSVVILHATALIDRVCQIVPNVKVVTNLPLVKNYSDVTVAFVRTDHALGKGLAKHSELNESHMINLVSRVEPFSNRESVIFTHLDLEKQQPAIKEFSRAGHFNNLHGVNDYNNCTDVVIYGHMYLPGHIFYDLQHQSFDDSTVEERKENTKHFKYARMASDVIQMINRGRCRGIVNGKAPEMRVSILMPKNKPLTSAIELAIQIEMPGVNVIEHPSFFKFLSEDNSKKLSPLSQKFLEALKDYTDEVSFASVCNGVGINKSGKETLIRHLKDPNSPLSKASPFIAKKAGQYRLFKKT